MPISIPFLSSITRTKKPPVAETVSSPSPASFGRLQSPVSIEKAEKKALSIAENASKCRHLERVFRYFDADGDGKISAAELSSCMTSSGEELSRKDAEDVVESTDSDGDGLLGFEDFVRLMEGEGEEEKKKDLKEAFGMYEMDGSGSITPKSLKRALSRLGEYKTIEECKVMISQFDLNGDGVLNLEEFIAMMV